MEPQNDQPTSDEQARVMACETEISEVLQKHRCLLSIRPICVPDDHGYMRMQTDVRIIAQPGPAPDQAPVEPAPAEPAAPAMRAVPMPAEVTPEV